MQANADGDAGAQQQHCQKTNICDKKKLLFNYTQKKKERKKEEESESLEHTCEAATHHHTFLQFAAK